MEIIEPSGSIMELPNTDIYEYYDKDGRFITKMKVRPDEVFLYCDHCGHYRYIKKTRYVDECINSKKPVNKTNDNTLWLVITIIIILLNLFFVLPLFI